MTTKETKATIADLIVEGLEDFADSLESGEDVTQRYNCRKVILELEPTSYDKNLVKATRKILAASQAVFAQFLGVSVKSVSAWEQGAKKPSDIACRFMDEIRANPKFWQARLKAMARPRLAEAES